MEKMLEREYMSKLRRKGWHIKQTFSNDFTHLLEDMYEKYGDEVFSIQGIANKHLDIAEFSRNFFGKSSNMADISIDGNANVKEKNIQQYNFETNKAIMKLNSLYTLFKCMKYTYDYETACKAVEDFISGNIFINDFHNIQTSYCYAFDLRTLLTNGMSFFKGGMTIKPPKRSDSFIALIIQSTAAISNQIMGACSYPDFFPVLDYFYRKEMGEDYIKDLSKKNETYIKNQFQNLVYSLNFPFRGNQSAFTNLSVMDMGFLKSLFGDYVFPDMTKPNLKSVMNLSKMFFEYFQEINGVEGIFTFPVMTLAISLDENNEYVDKGFAKWAAKANCEKSLANIFQSTPNAFSSCCRLRNEFDGVAESGYQNSFGVGGLSIGSHRVVGLNLPRLGCLEKGHPNLFDDTVEMCHKILFAHRKLIERRIEGGFMPLYSSNWIHLNKQYSTIGLIGAYEYLKNSGMDIRTKKGINHLCSKIEKIESKILEWQKEEKDSHSIYNIEQIPGESMAIRLAQLDTILGYNPEKHELYSNQYIPLIEKANIYDRFTIQGQLDSKTSGGAILHVNVDDDVTLNEDQFFKIMNVARETKTIYFGVNYAYSECEDGHYTIGKEDICPICNKNIVCQYTRVVGFITPVKSWNPHRREYEYPKRVFHTIQDMEDSKVLGE